MTAGFFMTVSSRERPYPEKSLRSSLAAISSTSAKKARAMVSATFLVIPRPRIENDERFH
jgi:hypothetical protein